MALVAFQNILVGHLQDALVLVADEDQVRVTGASRRLDQNASNRTRTNVIRKPRDLYVRLAFGRIGGFMTARKPRYILVALTILAFSLTAASQTAPKPLTASELLALTAGGVLPANVVHDIDTHGLSFHPDEDYRGYLKTAGTDATILAELDKAKIDASASGQKPDQELLQHLSKAAAYMNDKRYEAAIKELTTALDIGFAGPESGFVMGELLRRQENWAQSAAVYTEVLRKDPDFPDAHTKLSYLYYRLGDSDLAIHEAKAGLEQNPQDAEAHKNAGLALDIARKFDAAAGEFKEALRIKPDYAAVHFDLGIHFQNMQDYANAIVEYKKAIALDPNNPDPHYNLGNAYKSTGDVDSAIREFREAKRLDPNDPEVRENLASALMKRNVDGAIAELRELETMFPNFEVCHLCLGRGLLWKGDAQGAEAEFLKAAAIDPADPTPHRDLAAMREKAKNYDAALQELRIAEKLGEDEPGTHKDLGRVMLEKKDVSEAIGELKQAEALAPADWEVHDLYAQALEADGELDPAIAEYRQAVSLDPTQFQAISALGGALEKKGDWVAALQQDRHAALIEAGANTHHPSGESFFFSTESQKQYKAAQVRFEEHLRAMKAAGKSAEAAELQERMQAMDAAPEISEKMQLLLRTGDQAAAEKRYDDARKSYKEAVSLAQQLPPGNQDLVVALDHLGDTDAMLQDYANSEASYRQELTVLQTAFGPRAPRTTDALFKLGGLAGWRKDFVSAEKYFSQALDIDESTFGENSQATAESLRQMAGVFMIQNEFDKAEPYLLRAVKADEVIYGPDDAQLLIPLWGLCSLYDQWNKPDKSQPCWHRATGLMEKDQGENSPQMVPSLTNEAKALRLLGRNDEAAPLEERIESIQKLAAKTN